MSDVFFDGHLKRDVPNAGAGFPKSDRHRSNEGIDPAAWGSQVIPADVVDLARPLGQDRLIVFNDRGVGRSSKLTAGRYDLNPVQGSTDAALMLLALTAATLTAAQPTAKLDLSSMAVPPAAFSTPFNAHSALAAPAATKAPQVSIVMRRYPVWLSVLSAVSLLGLIVGLLLAFVAPGPLGSAVFPAALVLVGVCGALASRADSAARHR